jgi:hypothetical protein
MSHDDLPFDRPVWVVYARHNPRFHLVPPSPGIDTVIAWVRDNRIDACSIERFDSGGSNGLFFECRHMRDLLDLR